MLGQADKTVIRNRLQRTLRRNMTDAERKLWSLLRGRKLQGLKFRRQHPYEGYILDFVCLERKIIVELDGGQHTRQTAQDAERTLSLERAGFRVVRFWNHDVLQKSEAVVEKIWQESITDPSSPRPSP